MCALWCIGCVLCGVSVVCSVVYRLCALWCIGCVLCGVSVVCSVVYQLCALWCIGCVLCGVSGAAAGAAVGNSVLQCRAPPVNTSLRRTRAELLTASIAERGRPRAVAEQHSDRMTSEQLFIQLVRLRMVFPGGRVPRLMMTSNLRSGLTIEATCEHCKGTIRLYVSRPCISV